MSKGSRAPFSATNNQGTYAAPGYSQPQTGDVLAFVSAFVQKSELETFRDGIAARVDAVNHRLSTIEGHLQTDRNDNKIKFGEVEGKIPAFENKFWVIFSILVAVLTGLFLWVVPYLYNKTESDFRSRVEQNILTNQKAMQEQNTKMSDLETRVEKLELRP